MACWTNRQEYLYCIKWCSNSAQPDLPTLDLIAKTLGVDVKKLLNDTEIVGEEVKKLRITSN